MSAPSNLSSHRTTTLPRSLPAKPVPQMPPPPTTDPRIPQRGTTEVVPSSTPSEEKIPSAPASASNGPARTPHPAYVAAQAVTTPHCFIKGVTKSVSGPALTAQLLHYGEIQEMDIIRGKACAFVEFTGVDAAKRAIIASLPVAQGGGGGVRIEASGEVPSVRITIETKKARRERPVSRPRGGAPQGGTRDGGGGGSGFRRGLGRGIPRSGTQTLSAQSPAANDPVRTPHPAYVAAQAVTTSRCFVKGVTEPITQQALTTQLAIFGTIKELDIVRSKACAFVEFTGVDAAKRAIIASLPAALGGGGGVWVEAAGEVSTARITVETMKERGDRPVSRPRGGAPQSETRGGGGGPFRGARGRGGRVALG